MTAETRTRLALNWRVVPVDMLGSGRFTRVIERNATVHLRTWWILLSGFVEPVLYLFSIGIGIGKLVGSLPGPNGSSISYVAFVAPAMLASSAMNGGIYESTFNVYFKLKFAKIYDAILATPVSSTDVALGEIGYALLRGTLYGAMFMVVMALLGDIRSIWGLLAFPGVMLIGFAFSAIGMAATTYMRGWSDFDLVQLAILPLFLFSTTFYPLGIYPRWLQILVQCTPLFHGVVLERALCLGQVEPALALHALYLLVMGLVGVGIAARRVKLLVLS